MSEGIGYYCCNCGKEFGHYETYFLSTPNTLGFSTTGKYWCGQCRAQYMSRINYENENAYDALQGGFLQ